MERHGKQKIRETISLRMKYAKKKDSNIKTK